jgi:transposase-like protein
MYSNTNHRKKGGTTMKITILGCNTPQKLAAIRGEMTINEIASQFGVHGNQVVRWKKQALAELAEVFSDKREKRHASEEALGKNSTARSDN